MNETTRQPCGLSPGEDRSDDAVLSRCVETLKHEQDAVTTLGIQTVVQAPERLMQLCKTLLAGLLVRDSQRVGGIALGDLGPVTGLDFEACDHSGGTLRGPSPPGHGYGKSVMRSGDETASSV